MDFGGVTGGFQTPFNTMGIGNPVPGGFAQAGSGDLYWGGAKKQVKKKVGKNAAKQTRGCQFGMMNTEPLPLIVMADRGK